ncbi:SdpI family protein [Arthrobacter zhangbolii]|uniref:SdpI family protein n=1 Tax=Arthrobacter zhangbolii TaxID=2886936 RepID=A0A9X1M7S8_9MICC|nr:MULTISPECIES: SdpI family protein [Arthrobacter]MCC3271879.1 SdpI family protein [Arthrobacter zhangbolii]MDN3904955.1 SdpI family protein [Arthrobacter sp. YD2]UON93298.1 SdpI family protein [Arthrobacter zhangbolii]
MGITGVLLIICGAGLSWAAEATASGRMGINSLVGIRVGYVTVSEPAWRAGHRAARPLTHAAAGVFAALGIFALVFCGAESTSGAAIISGSLLVLGLILAAAVKANRAARAVVLAASPHGRA